MKKSKRRQPHRQQWHPPEYKATQIRAWQTLMKYSQGDGEDPPPPSPQMVKTAMDWLIHQACATYDEPFRPGSRDEVNYMLGRRSVGLATIKMQLLKPELFEDE